MPSKITLKEVFERIVALEAKFDISQDESKINVNKFRKSVFNIYLLQIINIVLTVVMVIVHIIIYGLPK